MVRGRLRNFANFAFALNVEWPMLLRVAVVCACVLGAASAIAEELGPDQARAFVVGKLEMTETVDVDGVPLRVVCTPGKLPLAEFALEIGKGISGWLGLEKVVHA